MNTKDLILQLNPEQKKAVMHTDGPLLIIAGAGTGKTKVITTKIAYLINKKIAKPEEILALTFTEKAASEMEERVDTLVPYGYANIFISTFHSFGDSVLRENAIELDLSPEFKVLDEAGQAVFLRDHIFEFELNHFRPLSNPARHIKAMLKYFSRLKDELITPDEFLKFAVQNAKKKDDIEAERILELAKAFETYENLMKEAGFVDYGDQVVKCYWLFKKNPHILKEYQEKFKYILVDEFQDTNFAQNELLKLLAEKKDGKNKQIGNITVVGDDDQSIFRFRGAAVSNILDFNKNYPNADKVILTKNYRSTKQILDASYRLIQHNNPDRLEVKYNIDKKLKTDISGANIVHFDCDTVETEARKVAEYIKEKSEKEGLDFNNFAILYRANSHAEPFITELKAKAIPYIFSGSSGLYHRPEVRLIISFVNVLTNHLDNLSFYHLATSEIYKVSPDELSSINSYLRRHNKSFRDIFSNLDFKVKDYLTDKTSKKLLTIIEDIKKFSDLIPNHNTGELLYRFVTDTGFIKKLLKEETPEAEVKIQNIAKFFERIGEFQDASFDKSIMKFKESLDLLLEAEEDPSAAKANQDINAVNLLTVHKSKGLEFDVVFVVNCVNGRFPGRKRGETISIPSELIKEPLPEADFHIQEERRLFYVAMTRAKKELILTSATSYGGVRESKISQFIAESLDEPMIAKKKHTGDSETFIEKFKKLDVEELPETFFSRDGRLNLSPHQLDDYISCPLKFKYVNILKVPVMSYHAVHYGTAVHAAVELYFLKKMKKRPITLEEIWEAFENAWVSEGYITREHEEERIRAGREALRVFYEHEKAQDKIPAKIEDKFSFTLETDSGPVRMNGRYDAVYERGDKIDIVDFKTSDVKEQEKADSRAKQSTQLAIYALSYFEMYGKNPDSVTLYFVDSGLKGVAKKTEKDFEKLKKSINDVASKIRDKKFSAKPSYTECSICAYKDICPYTETKI